MAYDFIGLVNDVNKRLNEVPLNSSNFASAQGYYAMTKEAVNSAIQHINQEHFEWPFNHQTTEVTLVIGQSRYTVPSTVKTADWDSFRIKPTDSTKTQLLRTLSYEDYLQDYVDEEYDEEKVGLPRYVVRTPDGGYLVYPKPDKEYTLVYESYLNPVELVSATDTPSVPEQFRPVIADGSMYYAYQFRGDTDNASMSFQKFSQGLNNMRKIYINRYDYVRSTLIGERGRRNAY